MPSHSCIRGRHPREFDFDRHGNMRKATTKHNTVDRASASSPNARRTISEGVLRDGALWTNPDAEYIAKVNKKKFVKASIGSKAAKRAERLELAGEELSGELATLCRALSARLPYLSMDRSEVAFAAKKRCRHFAHPTTSGVEALKTSVRFLVGLPRLVW